MSVIELKCPKCSAPVSPNKHSCQYCNTYYVIEGKMAFTLESQKATDENMKLVWEQLRLKITHYAEAQGANVNPNNKIYRKFMEEQERLLLLARKHLIEEDGELPTITAVLSRMTRYANPE